MAGVPITTDYVVRYDDIDFTNKAFLPSIINYFTDLATFQATSVGLNVDALKEVNRGWVICQWDIDITRLPHYNEKISVTTIPYSYKKFFAYRVFQIKDKDDNVIVEGKSSWMYLDTKRRRPIRLSFHDIKCFGLIEGDEEVVEVMKPQRVNDFTIEAKFDVRYTDIDTNNHVNNSKYITWALETLSIEFMGSKTPLNVRILYSKEKRYGGSITSKANIITEGNNTRTLHTICDNEDNRLCDIEILWK
ncbi:acyl-[acyl-carrier-protein] thioesterase [Clostridium cylindrosporum]|uniref:Acyl-acyl carrier protein thioesterase n=1 Tax=Clostridium cylindrosporum DSM 605 TaxID=1121307 RepID=A0A0J8D401_CLOCY|nr:acyl-ACP thioesterase domain-containing protein [Clostridium cylindrosporum]KMT20905.1 acyl-acyl carrier protein thioesterase [Clostridium cylindrosporum DSM 605]